MPTVSSKMPFKRVLPVMWIGIVLLFIAIGLLSKALFLMAALIVAVFGYWIIKKVVFNLADAVLDAGDALVVRSDGQEERIALSDIKNVKYLSYINPPLVTLSVRRQTVFGDTIAFFAPLWGIPVVHDLIDRVDAARMMDQDPKHWFERGRTNLELKYYYYYRPDESDKQLEEAIACFGKATDLKPDYAEAWFYKGVALAESGDHPSAVAAYEEALRLSPDHLEAWRRSEAYSWFERGLVELQRPDADTISERDNQLEDAVDCFERATVLKPDDAEAWFYKGAALAERWGDVSSALAAFEEALRLKPDHAEAWGRLATKCSVSAESCFAEVGRGKEPTQ
jgi:tetratricopeptide (TPR) repeat protein